MQSIFLKKTVSLVLCLVMVFAMLPIMTTVSVFADSPPSGENDIRNFVEVGKNLYSHTVQDGVFPSDWTRYENSWMYNPKSQSANITVSSGRTPAYVVLNNTDSGHNNTTGAVVFPSVGTANYVLTVNMRIGNNYGNFGLMTNIKDPLNASDGATLSYVSLNKSGTEFAGNGSAVVTNRWGTGSQVDEMNYVYSDISSSGTIKPGSTLTMKAYSIDGKTYFYINDTFVAYGEQRNPEKIASLCGVYCYNGKFQIYSVNIDEIFNTDINDKAVIGENLYSYTGATQQTDTTVPSGWTQLTSSNCNWLYNIGGSIVGRIEQWNGGNGVNLRNDGNGAAGVVFPSINTSDYVLSVTMRIGTDHGSYGLMTNIADPLSGATGTTLSYIQMTTSDSVTTGNAVQYNRVGQGQYDKTEYAYSSIGNNSTSATIYPGAIITMKAYSFDGCTYFYIDDQLVSYGAQKDPQEIKSLCGVYCYNTSLKIISVSIDKLEKKVFKRHSLTLGEDIGVNFLMDLSKLTSEEKSTSYMTFSVTDSEEEFTQVFADAFESDDKFGFTCPLSSLQMAKMITPIFHYGNGKTITGTSYSINDYTTYIINNSSSFYETYVNYATQLNNYFNSKDLITDGTIDILDLVQADYNAENDPSTYNETYMLNLSKAIMGIDKYLGDDIAEPICLPEIL